MTDVKSYEERVSELLRTKETMRKDRVLELEEICASSELWEENSEKARKLTAELTHVRRDLERWQQWRSYLDDAKTATEALTLEEDGDAQKFYKEEAEAALRALGQDLEDFELEETMNGPYDELDCRLEIQAGAGGSDAQDWCAMVLRMYTRCLEEKYQVKLIDSAVGDSPSLIKSATLEVRGRFAFGFLRSEKGAHRLVRQSPFNANAKRHTSFVSVEPTPILLEEDEAEIQIPDNDLTISTMRSSGAGGQNVNKLETAVRITHLPTGITVRCEKERTQAANKKIAMRLIKAKLVLALQEQRALKIADIRGDKVQADFGASLRNYVLHPYKLVKDSALETSNALDVLNGPGLLHFLEANLKQRASAPSSAL